MREVGIEEGSRDASTPVDRPSRDPKDRGEAGKPEGNGQLLNSSSATACRAIVTRLNYFGQDRSEIPFALKDLGRDMSTPTQASWVKMKRARRYLKGVSRAMLHFQDQAMPKSLVAWSDSDFAGCVKSRKSTSEGVIMLDTPVEKLVQ